MIFVCRILEWESFPTPTKNPKFGKGGLDLILQLRRLKGGNMMWFDGPQTLLIFKHEDVFQKYKDTRD